jgi:NitT/TauT family transport system ATP-binding protein
MAELADSLNFEIDDLFPMAETLQLLRFAELRGAAAADARRAPLCPSRCRSAQGDVRRGLLAHVPLAQHIAASLTNAPATRPRPAASATSWKTT